MHNTVGIGVQGVPKAVMAFVMSLVWLKLENWVRWPGWGSLRLSEVSDLLWPSEN